MASIESAGGLGEAACVCAAAGAGVPPVDALGKDLAAGVASQLSFDTKGLTAWDSGLLTFLTAVGALCAERGVTVDRAGLPIKVVHPLELIHQALELTSP